MHDHNPDPAHAAGGQSPPLSPDELTALFAIGLGVTTGDLTERPASDFAGASLTEAAATERLVERGLALAAPGGGLALTSSGQQAILDHARLQVAAQALAEEREQLERLRTDLLSTISHELRTPLTLIRTSIGLLLDSEPDAEMRLRLLRNIKQSTDRMHALVTDLLDLARLRQDRLDLSLRRLDLADLVQEAALLMRPLLETRGQRVAVVAPPSPLMVSADLRRLERVLLNLLANANTFGPIDSVITITLARHKRDAVVAVRDTGPGITPEAIPFLFEQFFTERTSSSRHNIGAGLGLPIAKGIVEAHGGRIWVESTVGTGTTVWFTLPLDLSTEERDEDPGR